MPIVAVNGGGNTPQGVNDGDVDGRDFLVWQRGGSPLETGGVSVAGGDVNGGDEGPDLLVGVTGSDIFNFQPQLTSEPTAPEAGKHEGTRDWIKVESWGLADPLGDPVTYTYTVSNPSTAYDDQPAVQDTGLLLPY